MPGHDLIVVGASAGGVEALMELVSGLPSDLPAAVCVVLHVPASGTSMLPQILNRAGTLSASHARDGELLRHGRVYVAPPDSHLVTEPARLRLVAGPRENGHRPSVDVLFRTAAAAYGPRAIGVVLSGTLDDGTAGLLAIKRRGGVAVVQQPADARYPGMPQSALEHVVVDYALPVADMGPVLARLAAQPVQQRIGRPSPDLEEEIRAAELDMARLNSDDFPGEPSVYACPECHGALWEMHDGDLLRFRCRVGHAYTAESLLAGQASSVEAALWAALRALEEKASLSGRLAERAAERGYGLAAEGFEEQEQDARQRAAVIRNALLGNGETLPAAGTAEAAADVPDDFDGLAPESNAPA
ncbi:MAG TPA: chemotaxis protein CheB [Chloroflexota bacterium]|jgi:two-component system chemotaxis response regulator CheB